MPVEDILASRDFSNLLSLFDHDRNDVVVRAVDAVAKILNCGGDIPKSQKSPLQEDFRDAGGILLTLALLMGKAETDPLIKCQATSLLRICARHPANASAIIEQDGLFLMLQYLQDSTQEELQEHAGGCLMNICGVKGLNEAVMQAGGMEVIVTVLQQTISKSSTKRERLPKVVFILTGTLSFLTETEMAYQHEFCQMPGALEMWMDCLRECTDDATMVFLRMIFIAIVDTIENNNNEDPIKKKDLQNKYRAIWSFPQKWFEANGLQVCKHILTSATHSAAMKLDVCYILDKAKTYLSQEMLDMNMLSICIEIALSDPDNEDLTMKQLRESLFGLAWLLTEVQATDHEDVILRRAPDQIVIVQMILRYFKEHQQQQQQHPHLSPFERDLLVILGRLLNNNRNTCQAAWKENDTLSVFVSLLAAYQNEEELLSLVLYAIMAIAMQLKGLVIPKESGLIDQLVHYLAPGTSLSLQECAVNALASFAVQSKNKPLLQESSFVEFIVTNLQLISQGCEGVSKVFFLNALRDYLYDSSDLCRIDAIQKTLEDNESLLLQELYLCLSSTEMDEEANLCRVLAAKILNSLAVVTVVINSMVKQFNMLSHIVSLLDIRFCFNDVTHELEIRELISSLLLKFCGPHMDDEDNALFERYQIEQRIQHVLSFETNKNTINNGKGILKWINYMREMVAFRRHVKLLKNGQWVAPMDCTLRRVGIPIELRRIIKRYQYRSFTSNDVLRKMATNWEIHDPMLTYKEYGHISEWDTAQVTNMDYVFRQIFGRSSFNEDIENWDVSKVTSMISMFENAVEFNKPLNLWDVSSVKNMVGMFSRAATFNQPLDRWNVSNVKNFNGIFQEATAFNQPQLDWDKEATPTLSDAQTGNSDEDK